MKCKFKSYRRYVFIIFLLISIPSLEISSRQQLKSGDVFKMTLEELLNVEVASTFSESELDVGSTVHTVTEKDWRKYGAENLLSATRFVPSFFPLPNTFGSAISVRGYTNNLSVRGLAHLVDGVPVNNLSDATSNYEHPFYELGGLDKIEIISGPGSSIYGSDAFHGVLSLKTFRSHKDRFSIYIEGGSHLSKRAQVKISRGISKFTRFHAVAALTNQADQKAAFQYTLPFTQTVESATRQNSFLSASAILKVDTSITKSIEGHAGLYYSKWKSDGFPSAGRFYGSGQSILQDKDVSGNNADFWMSKGGFIFQLPKRLELSIDTYFWRSSLTRRLDRSRLPPPFTSDISHDIKDDRKLGLNITLKQDKNKIKTQWLLRYQYNRSWVHDDSWENYHPVTGALTDRGTANADGFKRIMNSLVFQAKTGIFKRRVFILYGCRIDKYSDFGTQITPRLGLICKPAKHSSVKFLYGNAFRAPTPNEALGSGLVKSNRDLEAETIDSYELVYIYRGKNTRLSLTLFRSDWKNGIQVDAIDQPPYNLQYKNTGRNRATGIEFSINADLQPLSVDLSGSYVFSKDMVRDWQYTAFPKYIFNIGCGYSLEKINTQVYIVNRLFFQAHTGPVTIFDPEPVQLPVYFRTDINIQWWSGKRFTLALTLRNLLNIKNVLPSVWSVENGIKDKTFNMSLGLAYRL